MKLFKKIFENKKKQDFINDRRESKRYDIALKLNYSDSEARRAGESVTKNISVNGIRFSANTKFLGGSLLDIKVEDPNSDKYLSFKGRVAWIKEFAGKEELPSFRYEAGVRLLKNRLF